MEIDPEIIEEIMEHLETYINHQEDLGEDSSTLGRLRETLGIS